ncbi:hypothetical protein ACXR0O_02420 [Verrucomicrobiota bacterium sgz303538]
MDSDASDSPLSIEQFHRKMAADLFNGVWALLDKEERNCAETDRMIHAAHASRFHWEFGGSPVNLAIGEWQCSRVHAVVKQPDAAIYHALRYLELAEDYQLGAFHVAYAHEALARAYLITDREKAAHHLERARAAVEEINDKEERALVEKDLTTIVLEKSE